MSVRHVVLSAALLATAAPPAMAQKNGQKSNDEYSQAFDHYLTVARSMPTTAPATPWMASLFSDVRARSVNDLVTVRVVENIAASGAADAALDKTSKGAAGVTALAGDDLKFASWFDPSALARWSTGTDFKGSGATTRTGALSAVITARVTEVLPNGDLVLEGVREIDINGDRQMIVLNGVVRPADVGPGNVVSSTAVGQMRIRYFGRGLIKDNLSPGWLVRAFNKIF